MSDWSIDARGLKSDVLDHVSRTLAYVGAQEHMIMADVKRSMLALIQNAPEGATVLAIAHGDSLCRYFHFEVTP